MGQTLVLHENVRIGGGVLQKEKLLGMLIQLALEVLIVHIDCPLEN